MIKFIDTIKKNILFILAVFISFSLLFFIDENLYKVIVLEIFTWFWFYLGRKFKNFTYSGFLLLLTTLPFNITAQFGIDKIDPYVNGVFTNYLVPTVSILDLFSVIFLISSLKERKIFRKDISFDLMLLIVLGIIQFIFKRSLISIIGILRITNYLLVFRVVHREVKIRGDMCIVRILEVLIILETGVAFLQFLNGSSIGIPFLGESVFSSGMKGSSFMDFSGNLYIRGYGTFPHPNILAGWFLMVMIILWKSRKGFLFIAISALGIVLTFSRVGMFLMLIFVIFYFFEYWKYKKNDKIYSVNGLVLGRISNLFNGIDNAAIDRIKLFRESLDIFRNNFLTGTGYGYFVKEMGSNMPRTTNGVLLNQPVHNVFLLSLCELGIPGTIVLSFCYWKTFLRKRVNIKNMQNVFIILCLLIIGMIDHYFLSLPQGIVICMMLLFTLSV